MNLASTGAKPKPSLDEGSFQQLLAAAYVVQQHNDGLRAADPARNTSSVLSEIAEIQALVRAGGFDLRAAAALTAERLQKITRADGVNASILSADGALQSITEVGPAAHRLMTAASLVTQRLKPGDLFVCPDTQADARIDAGLCREAKAGALVAAPILRFDETIGTLDLRWSRANAFGEADVRAVRLMAGLVSSLAERNLRAQERRKAPEFTAAAASQASDTQLGDEEVRQGAEETVTDQASKPVPAAEPIQAAQLPSECRVCGRPFGAAEAFCGKCSMPRLAGAAADDLQSKWASMWYMQQAQEARERGNATLSRNAALDLKAPEAIESKGSEKQAQQNIWPEHRQDVPEDTGVIDEKKRTREFTEAEEINPSSAPRVRMWHVPEFTEAPKVESQPVRHPYSGREVINDVPLPVERTSIGLFDVEKLANSREAEPESNPELLQRTWQSAWARTGRRHATFVLTVAGLLLAFLLLAVWPSSKHSQLTWMQSLLVELGLADVPVRTPVLAGKSDVRVWVDVHTALYYCPGSDLYGKTPGGHFATQREAQQDEFEPASRNVCE